MIIQVPLSGGLNTQADPEEIGVNAATELINAYVDKPGMIRKRPGRGAAFSVSANINHIAIWVFEGTPYHILTLTDGKVYAPTSAQFDSGTLLSVVFDATGTDVKILHYGNTLRFITGLDDADDAQYFFKGSRNFFWSTVLSLSGVYPDAYIARPRAFGTESDGMTLYDAGIVHDRGGGSGSAQATLTSNFIQGTGGVPVETGGTAPSLPSGFDYDNDTYFYKLTKVYDGVQESPLPEDILTSTLAASKRHHADTNFATFRVSTDYYFGFQFEVTHSTYDKRITAFNVYRAKNDSSGPYYKIDSISALGQDAAGDPSLVHVTDAKTLWMGIGGGNTGTLYIADASAAPTVSATLVKVAGSATLGTVSAVTSDGYGYFITANITGTAVQMWNEPITWSGGGASGKAYSSINPFVNCLYSESWNFKTDEAMGNPILVSDAGSNDMNTGSPYPLENASNACLAFCERNITKVMFLSSTLEVGDWIGGGIQTGLEVHTHSNYFWANRAADTSHCFWYDKSFTDGATHPFGTASIKTKFKHSVNLDGRQYVGNVKIYSNSGVSELHPDWVIFSELLQPDVLPITNYISIPDIQGGEITGLARLLGDLVIFQEKGIYRLAVPSADPTTWSLAESEPNLGCIATNSITEYENGVFFAGRDNLYYLNANFEALPVTGSIRDDYQAFANIENTRTHIDPKKERLLCRFGDTVNTTYVLDLKAMSAGSEHWTKLDNTGSKDAHLFLTDENFVTYTVEAGATSYLCELDPSSPSESTSFKRTTGWIAMNDLDKPGTLSRINLRYKSPDALTVKIYTDGDASTAVAWQDGNTYKTISASSSETLVRVKPAIRCRYYMIEISSAASTNAVEIYRMETDFG